MSTVTSETKDKITVGLTPAGGASLEREMGTGRFKTDLDAYRLAISVALARGLVADPDAMTGVKTKFNVGSLDPDGRIRTMIGLMVPEAGTRVYDHAERRAEAGLEFLARKLVDDNALLSEVLLGEEQVRQDEESQRPADS